MTKILNEDVVAGIVCLNVRLEELMNTIVKNNSPEDEITAENLELINQTIQKGATLLLGGSKGIKKEFANIMISQLEQSIEKNLKERTDLN